MSHKKFELKSALMKFRVELLIIFTLMCLSCFKEPIVKTEPAALELCEAWNARQNVSQITFEGSLDLSSERASGSWDIIAFIEKPNKIKILLFDPFFGMEAGRLESTEKGVRFVYGETNFKIRMSPEILVQAFLAKPDCSLVQANRKNVRYELAFEGNTLSSWTVWKNLTIIYSFAYFEGFDEEASSAKPRAIKFFCGLDEQGVEGVVRLTN